MIQCDATGLVYSNPRPYLKAIHAWHPSLVELAEGELLCAFDLGEAAESLDYRTYLATHENGDGEWTPPRRLFHDSVASPTTHTVRISRMRDGTLVGLGARFYRDDPEGSLTNRDTLGLVPMDMIMLTSRDSGRTWSGPSQVRPPLAGPAFEVCHAIVELADGTWLAPTQTWPDWNGNAPNGMTAVALVSRDRGQTWPEYVTVFDGNQHGIIHFEQSIIQFSDGRLLAVAWAYDRETRKTRPTPYAVSRDGKSFSAPQPTQLYGQTAKLLYLGDDRFVCVYRRDDKPGLWIQLARLEGDAWVNLEEKLLWRGVADSSHLGSSISDELSSLRFGFPSLVRLKSGEVMIVFWCEEKGTHNIRWFRLSIDAPAVPRPHSIERAGKQLTSR
jgi:sialidase-1